MLPGSSEVPVAVAGIAQRQGHWDEATAYFDQALVLDPRNTDLLVEAAFHYVNLRKFEAALKLFDRALDILPGDPDVMAFKVGVYQGEGNLESQACAVLGDRDSALKEAERTIALRPSAKSLDWGPRYEENLALIRTIIGENTGTISMLARLLEEPYWSAGSSLYGTPVTRALLRVDPTWDALRTDPAFRRLYEEEPK